MRIKRDRTEHNQFEWCECQEWKGIIQGGTSVITKGNGMKLSNGTFRQNIRENVLNVYLPCGGACQLVEALLHLSFKTELDENYPMERNPALAGNGEDDQRNLSFSLLILRLYNSSS